MADEILDYLETACETSQYEAAGILLNKLPLERLESGDYHALLDRLLRKAIAVEDDSMARLVYNVFSEANENEQTFPLFAEMFTLLAGPDEEAGPYSDDLLEYMARQVLRADFSAFDLLSYLTAQDSSPEILLAAERVVDAYSSQDEALTRDRYRALLKKAIQLENDNMIDFFSTRLQEIALYAPKASYLRPAEDGKVPYEDEVPLPEPVPLLPVMQLSIEQAVELLTAGLRDVGLDLADLADAQKKLRAQLQVSNAAEREALLAPVLKSLDAQRAIEQASPERLDEIFRIVGPINAMYGSDLADRENICCRYGGCTMFYCQQFEQADEEDADVEGEVDWYRGACDYCDLRIVSRWSAVRRPLIHGGWKGCFCSWRCVRASVDSTEPDLAVASMIARVSAQLDTVGILDRKPRDAPDRYEFISSEEREKLYETLAGQPDEEDEEAGTREAQLVEGEEWPEPSEEEGWQTEAGEIEGQ